jgi:hypothetical protein
VCKFYQGVEDKTLEKRLKALFGKVHREKPESSRSVGLSSPSTGFKLLTRPSRNLKRRISLQSVGRRIFLKKRYLSMDSNVVAAGTGP